jgi:glutamine cyclotransferase
MQDTTESSSQMTRASRGKPPGGRGVRVLGVLGLCATAVVVSVVARHGALTTTGGAGDGRVSSFNTPGVTAFGETTTTLGESHEVPRPKTDTTASETSTSFLPKVWTYKVINKYPHDANAFTQGLAYQSPDVLVESTGSVGGPSTVRSAVLISGKVVLKRELPTEFFAEGLTKLPRGTAVGNKGYVKGMEVGKRDSATTEGAGSDPGGGDLLGIESGVDLLAQIVWKKNVGFLYDAATLTKVGSFKTPLQDGWGLTTDPYDPDNIILTDATDLLTFVKVMGNTGSGSNDPEWPLVKQVKIRDGERSIRFANELETVGDEIWANVIETECIVRIDPASGQVLGWIDLQGLRKQCDPSQTPPNVMNGIAYDAANDRIFVTGKKWSNVFEVTLEQSDASLSETRKKCWPAVTLPQYGYL